MYQIDFKHFPEHVIRPTILADSERYLIKIAETEEEVKATLRLRYEIFNLEQGHGLDQCSTYGLDFDEYDKYCIQLVVMDKNNNTPVGTYRLHLGSVAMSAKGFYSASEFDIEGIDKIADISMELGRSCVSPEFRTGAAVALLWGGIGELMMRARFRYLFGCVSFEKHNPAAAWALYEYFKKDNKITDIVKSTPKKGYELQKPPREEIDKYLVDIRSTARDFLPPLFKGYLRLGTKVCGEPLYDPVFKTIDFLILLDSKTVPDRYARHYNYKHE